jgi:hypothetical protein
LPYPCARCGEVINAGDLWDLDHLQPLALGGGDETPDPLTSDATGGTARYSGRHYGGAGYLLTNCKPAPFLREPVG